MDTDLAIRLLTDMLLAAVKMSAPILLATLAVGLVISIVQVVTQVQEMSLTFVPKLITAGVSLVVFGPWMLRTLSQFATRLWTQIPAMFAGS